MSPDAIAAVNTPGYVITAPVMPHLLNNSLDPVALSNDIEKQIRALIIQHRKVHIKLSYYAKICSKYFLFRILVIQHNLMIIYHIY